jgi:hypothetical protein
VIFHYGQWENMQKHKEQLLEMSALLTQLVESAKKLNEAVAKSITEKELDTLQEKQQKILHKLVELDKKLNEGHAHTTEEKELHNQIEKQLREFENLNKAFFEHLQARLSLIQFSKPKESKETSPEEE